MRYNLKNEIPILIIVILPFLYLGATWNSLPDIVPIHWNFNGEIDSYGKKETLLWIPFLLPFLTYLIFTFAPVVDPKKNLRNMGDKLNKLKFLLTLITSVLALVIIHSSKQQELSITIIPILIGALFSVLGNFFPTLKPNYFIGIRTPWTLNSDSNWKQTHRFAGKLWLIRGIFIIIYSLIARPEISNLAFLCTTVFIALSPVVYSYKIFKNKKIQSGNNH